MWSHEHEQVDDHVAPRRARRARERIRRRQRKGSRKRTHTYGACAYGVPRHARGVARRSCVRSRRHNATSRRRPDRVPAWRLLHTRRGLSMHFSKNVARADLARASSCASPTMRVIRSIRPTPRANKAKRRPIEVDIPRRPRHNHSGDGNPQERSRSIVAAIVIVGRVNDRNAGDHI